MGLPPPPRGRTQASLASLPAEIRGIIWEFVLNLNARNERRRIRIVSDREVVRNTNAGSPIQARPRPVNVAFRYTSPDNFRTVPKDLPFRLVDQQSNADVARLMARSQAYLRGLRTIMGSSSVTSRQAIRFHPRLDTIVMDIPTMIDLHLNWQDTYGQSRMQSVPALLGLVNVQNLVLPITRDDLRQINMLALRYFIRVDQIPDLGSESDNESDSGSSQIQALDALTPYFPKAIVSFQAPARDRTVVDMLFMLIQAQMMKCIPFGQEAAGSATSLANPANEHQHILNLIASIDEQIERYFRSENP
jgi:choline dehydrogenase-like flavoprotein